MKDMIVNRISYPIALISKVSRIDRLKHNIERGNHSVFSKIVEFKINDFISEETAKGYLLPIPKNHVLEIPGTEACPIHIV